MLHTKHALVQIQYPLLRKKEGRMSLTLRHIVEIKQYVHNPQAGSFRPAIYAYRSMEGLGTSKALIRVRILVGVHKAN